MQVFFRRLIDRYSKQLAVFAAGSAFLLIYSQPLKLLFIDSEKGDYKQDPKVVKNQEDILNRQELVKKKYQEYRECVDPTEKERIKNELDDIHRARLRGYANFNWNNKKQESS